MVAKAVGTIVFVLFPDSAQYSVSASEFYWLGYSRCVFVPFLAAFLLSGYGLVANINAWPASRVCRLLGALLGFYIWFVLLGKLAISDAFASLGFVLGVAAAFCGELGVVFTAAANLPRPGAPGNMGRDIA